LEIGTEELPTADLDAAVQQLQQHVPAWLDEQRLPHGEVEVVGTPRRLVVRIAGVAAAQPDQTRLVKGPPARVAFDAAGHPIAAARGFARRQGIDVADLRAEEVDGGTYAVARVTQRGRPAIDVLAEALPPLIAGLEFPRSMRWNASNVAFSRPLRWLVALLGDRVVRFTYAGVASGRTSHGLRSAGSPLIEIASAAAYADIVAAAGIVLDHQARVTAIRERCRALAAEIGGTVPDDPDLLAEIANLVEAPLPLRGSFGAQYLDLPREVLVTVMHKHQRYVPVERDGRLLPAFIAVANGPVDPDTVRQGNEAVLEARYADAAFFWKHDRAAPLESRLPKLAGLTFHATLGSMLDKTRRVERLTPIVARAIGLSATEQSTAERIARLAKADLVTEMVIELTSLQGVMGYEYARHDGEPEAVATGIFEHALPRHAGDALPSSRPAIAVGIADRLDSLVGLFAAGLAPRATADPFALRRTALGLVQVLAGRDVSLDLRTIAAAAAALQPIPTGDALVDEVLAFIRRRLEQWLLDQDFRHDVVQAVLAARAHDPARAAADVRDLNALVTADSFAALLAAYSRAARIVRGQHKHIPGSVDPALFEHDAERALWRALQRARETVSPDLAVGDLVARLEPLAVPINALFEQVFVMTDDARLRANRLALLQQIADLPDGIVDLTLLRGA
jgi:glycyl-tRNA synthetase